MSEGDFRELDLKATYSPDDRPFDDFYLPLLRRAISYDRAVGYWSAAELQFAAQGTAHFLANGGKMRLIVGAQLIQKDVDAVMDGKPLDEVLAEKLLADPELEGARIVERDHLSVLAWMVANDRLEIRVGVPRDAEGRLLTHQESGKYFHTKYGIFSDGAGNKVAFNGSNNASVTAWVRNHETFDVFPSWNEPIWDYIGQEKVDDFERHWNEEADPGWAVVDLPLAVAQRLIEHAPIDMPVPKKAPRDDRGPGTPVVADFDVEEAWAQLVSLAKAPEESAWTSIGTSWAQPLPHQAHLIHRVVSTFPRGYLFADEVGLGKTVEAGLVLRELFASDKAKKALLLVPATVMKQWQEELHEKMNLDVPRYEGKGFLDRFDNEIPFPSGANPWSAFPIVLASSHLARRRDRRRQVIDAGPWDVVLVDEAHHARRRGSKPTDTPNALLNLLLEMKSNESWRALYLASATPMQMNPHEAWDLISLLGLPGRWGDQAQFFLRYFQYLNANPQSRGWKLLCEMVGDYFSDPLADRDLEMERQVEQPEPVGLGFAGAYVVLNLPDNVPSADMRAQFPNLVSDWLDRWLRRHNPMRDRVFRNTRRTMRAYQEAGIIGEDVTIPFRHVNDDFIPLKPKERELYERIEQYIRRHYNAYKSDQTQQALGFIMTVYRRRLTSSFEAIKRSLRRRLDVLERGLSLGELLTADDAYDIEGSLFDPEEFDSSADRLKGEISELRDFLMELDNIQGEDTKATRLVDDVHQALSGMYDSVVVFTQYADTMEYARERLLAAGYKRLACYSGRGGELYEESTGQWLEVSKAEIKTRFRAREIEVLIGTDSMSEGLNLQTCGRLINYDMPWNLMRVEQRIGRVDRIGATYVHIHVSNYFYADTVEEQVYKGIAKDFGDFTQIVGEAAPVLANIEKIIEHLALTGHVERDEAADEVQDAVEEIRSEIGDLQDRPVRTNDLGAAPDVTGTIVSPPDLVGAVSLPDLEHILTTNPLTSRFLVEDHDDEGLYWLTAPSARYSSLSFDPSSGVETVEEYLGDVPAAEAIPITFDREFWDESRDVDLVFLTYGSPELSDLLPRRSGEND